MSRPRLRIFNAVESRIWGSYCVLGLYGMTKHVIMRLVFTVEAFWPCRRSGKNCITRPSGCVVGLHGMTRHVMLRSRSAAESKK